MSDLPPVGRRDPDDLLARAGIRGKPAADQHFLIDDRVLDRLPTYAGAFDLARVLEIGAGTGALTDRLLVHADHVTAVERDRQLATFLRSEFAEQIEADRLTVITGDALTIDLPEFTASVCNLPYGAASEILFRLLPVKRPLVAMVQREFAERMVASPGTSAYGRLSVTAQHYAAIELVETVPPEAFEPPPAVESAVIRAAPREPDYAVPSEEFFMAFVRAVFTQRRKTMRNAIRNTAHMSGLADPDAVVDAADQATMARRPERLTPAEFAALAELAYSEGRPK